MNQRAPRFGRPPGLHFRAMTDQGERSLSSVPGLGAGPVMVIGGAEDKVRDKVILSRFAKFAGGEDGHVVVISTASSLGDQATEVYRALFTDLGIGTVTGVRPDDRDEADDPAMTAAAP